MLHAVEITTVDIAWRSKVRGPIPTVVICCITPQRTVDPCLYVIGNQWCGTCVNYKLFKHLPPNPPTPKHVNVGLQNVPSCVIFRPKCLFYSTEPFTFMFIFLCFISYCCCITEKEPASKPLVVRCIPCVYHVYTMCIPYN